MGRSLCNADQGGYNVIWEAGTEGTDSVRTGGAVASVCGPCMSCGCEFLENSRLSLRAALLLDQSCHVPCCCRDRGKECCGGEPGMGEQAGCGRRKEAEGPGTAAQSQCVLPLPLTWMGEETPLHRKDNWIWACEWNKLWQENRKHSEKWWGWGEPLIRVFWGRGAGENPVSR